MEALSHGRGPEPSDFHTPAVLHHAFLSAIHFAVGYNPTKRSSAWRQKYLNECRDRITKGMHQMTKDLEEASLEYREAILPLGLVGALLSQIMHDVNDRHHLVKTYRDHLYRLVSNLICLNVGGERGSADCESRKIRYACTTRRTADTRNTSFVCRKSWMQLWPFTTANAKSLTGYLGRWAKH